jgi:hypothetical protein
VKWFETELVVIVVKWLFVLVRYWSRNFSLKRLSNCKRFSPVEIVLFAQLRFAKVRIICSYEASRLTLYR